MNLYEKSLSNIIQYTNEIFFFLYAHLRYHLKDVIVGKIYFLLVRIKIRYMELAIVRRETTGAGDPHCEGFGLSIGSCSLITNPSVTIPMVDDAHNLILYPSFLF